MRASDFGTRGGVEEDDDAEAKSGGEWGLARISI